MNVLLKLDYGNKKAGEFYTDVSETDARTIEGLGLADILKEEPAKDEPAKPEPKGKAEKSAD